MAHLKKSYGEKKETWLEKNTKDFKKDPTKILRKRDRLKARADALLATVKTLRKKKKKPQKKYPKLKYLYSNLFYSCKECNSSKRDYDPSVIQSILKLRR